MNVNHAILLIYYYCFYPVQLDRNDHQLTCIINHSYTKTINYPIRPSTHTLHTNQKHIATILTSTTIKMSYSHICSRYHVTTYHTTTSHSHTNHPHVKDQVYAQMSGCGHYSRVPPRELVREHLQRYFLYLLCAL